ncbi:MAG: AMP-binding protein [SAR324 cluster bacterium]|nr:AMP-binding protein [SAR324 cluster bacterium]
MDGESFSLLPAYRPEATVAWWRGGAVPYSHLLASIRWLAARLPEATHAFNLCEDRFLFLAGFSAVISRLQTNLLPANRLPREIHQVAKRYPDSYCLVEREIPELDLPQVVCQLPDPLPTLDGGGRDDAPPMIPGSHLAAVPFTSGSTGVPKPNPKAWASLIKGAGLWKARFWEDEASELFMVATVPPQHMYGLETTIMLPLAAGVAIHGGRPFFPRNIREALSTLPRPVGLITTPIHLRACVEAGLDWPEVRMVVSATAPLSAALAARAEAAFGGPVLEIYGCTEGGTLASRRTLDGATWRLLDGLTLHQTPSPPQGDISAEGLGGDFGGDFGANGAGGGDATGDATGNASVSGGHLSTTVALQDIIERETATTFRLVGRGSDIVNIAGKRGSLADLNIKLRQVEGVEDGVFVMPGDGKGATTRLTALVIAPGMSAAEVMAGLETQMDAAFLPRPIYLVEALPYNELGKLPRRELQAWIERSNPDTP